MRVRGWDWLDGLGCFGDAFGIPYMMGIILTKTIKYSFLGGFVTIRPVECGRG